MVRERSGMAQMDGDATSEGVPPMLGDFELLREIGRGEMGVVYEICRASSR
jgi:hypothetical protein